MSDQNKQIISKKKFKGTRNNHPGLRQADINFSSRDRALENSGISREDIRKLIAYLETL